MKQSYPHAHTATTETRIEGPRILCGATNCYGLASIWLTDEEERQYVGGLRSFKLIRHQRVQVM